MIRLIATPDEHIYRRQTSTTSKEGNTYLICYHGVLTKKTLKQKCPTTAILIEDRVHIRFAHNHDPDNKLLQELEACASILHVAENISQPESSQNSGNQIDCPQCDKSFSFQRITQHINEVHFKIKRYTCTFCNMTFFAKSNMKIHIKAVHDKIEDVACSECDFKTSYTLSMRNHKKSVHSNERPHKCYACEYTAKTARDVKMHITNIHISREKLKCNEYEFMTTNERSLQIHIKAAHQRKGVKCQVCEKKTLNMPFTYNAI